MAIRVVRALNPISQKVSSSNRSLILIRNKRHHHSPQAFSKLGWRHQQILWILSLNWILRTLKLRLLCIEDRTNNCKRISRMILINNINSQKYLVSLHLSEKNVLKKKKKKKNLKKEIDRRRRWKLTSI